MYVFLSSIDSTCTAYSTVAQATYYVLCTSYRSTDTDTLISNMALRGQVAIGGAGLPMRSEPDSNQNAEVFHKTAVSGATCVGSGARGDAVRDASPARGCRAS